MTESIRIRQLEPNDYDDLLVGWWQEWGWEPPQKDFLPHDGAGGAIVYVDDTPVVAGYLYLTNSTVAWIDFIVSSKQFRKKPERQEAITFLVEYLTEIAKTLGCKYAYALVKHNGLISTYEKLGYVAGDQYTKEMIKQL